jgi:hypothetical protein
VHPFCSSHEEEWPWMNFELHDRPWGSSAEREERGNGMGRGRGGHG